MSTIPFWRDPVFWSVLLILTSFWLAGFASAWKNEMATSNQTLRKGLARALHWTIHCGFWYLLVVLQPVLAYGAAKTAPQWRDRQSLVIVCLLVGGIVGYVLQTAWSRAAGSSDAWSEDGKPNLTGIIHIGHMTPEIGIMLMLLLSGLWFQEMSWSMFFGTLAIVMSHLLLGNHWPLRILRPASGPEHLTRPMPQIDAVLSASLWTGLVLVGFALLAKG